MKKTTRFMGLRRRLFQWMTTLMLLLLPWLEADGKSLLRIDIPNLSLYLFGQILRIQELYLVMLVSIILAMGFLLVTVVLGRVWCGWLCPQTTLSDVAEWVARHLGLKVRHYSLHGSLWRKFLLQVFFVFLAFLVAANLLWYFIPPLLFFARLVRLDLHYGAWITLIITGLVIYLDLALVRRLMCRDFCPYGRIQTSLVDNATLSLHLSDTKLEQCIECDSCVRVCPMEIDIRDGYQVECTNCGQCLDACHQVMAKRSEPGLIRYTFGLHNEGARRLINPRVLLPAVVMLLLTVILSISLSGRPTASLKIAVSHTAAVRLLANDQMGTFFNAWVNNYSQETVLYTLEARNKKSGNTLLIKGQKQATLKAGKNQRLDFILITPANELLTVEFVLKDKEEVELSVTEAYIGKNTKE